MINENVKGLQDQVKFTGFKGDDVAKAIEENISKGLQNFSVEAQVQYGRDVATANLHFKKSGIKDNYFFNRYDLSVKFGHLEHPYNHTFYITNLSSKHKQEAEEQSKLMEGEKKRNPNITLKEGYNLLAGRSVYKSFHKLEKKTGMDNRTYYAPTAERYNTWAKLDLTKTDENGKFKMDQYGEKYGFDHKAAIEKLNLKEMREPTEAKKLLESIERGNQQQVTYILSDGSEKMGYTEAAPRFKSMNKYDDKHKPLKNIEDLKESIVPSEKQSSKKEVKEGVGDGESGPRTKVKKPVKRGKGISAG